MNALAAWLATYALHSTLLLGVTLLVSRRLPGDAWRDLLWKAALFGGLLTASVQVGAGYAPAAGRLALAEARATSPATSPAAEPAPAAHREDGAPGVRSAEPPPPAGPPTLSRPNWVRAAVIVWAAGAALLLLRLAMQHVWLFRALRGRRRVDDGPLAAMLAELRRNAGFWRPVRLSTSAACPTPIALGRAEICLPERFGTDLDPEQQRSALAHELAHLRRGDPLWQLAAGVAEAAFFFQPLQRRGRMHWREAAENLCDDWAVQSTGSSLGLARCLTDVASWVGTVRVPQATAAMAEGGSPLLRRVERLAEWRSPEGGSRWRPAAAAAVLVALVAAAAPTVSHGTARPNARSPTATTGLAVAVPPDTVLLPPSASAPLASRWEWALRNAPAGGAWIGWGVRGPRRASFGGQAAPVASGDQAPAGSASMQEIVADEDFDVAFVLALEGSARAPSRMRLRSADAPIDLRGLPLVWLGTAGADESIAQLRTLRSGAGDALRAELAAAVALHANTGSVLRGSRVLLAEESVPAIRSELVQWLPRAHPRSDAVAAALVDIAFGDAAATVRAEAVDALSDMGGEQARIALERVAREHPELKLRSEAAQTLAHRAP